MLNRRSALTHEEAALSQSSRVRAIMIVLAMVCALPASAQPQPVDPAVPYATPAPAFTLVPLPAADPRLAACPAATQDGFRPFVLRPGDTLGGLIAGQSTYSPAQIAALNCLPHPDDLPVAALVWLPAEADAVRDLPARDPVSGPTPVPNVRRPRQPAIISFTAAPGSSNTSVMNTQPVMLTWETRGADVVYLYPCPANDTAPCPRPLTAIPTAATGTLMLNGFPGAGVYRWQVEIAGPYDAPADGAAPPRDLVVTGDSASVTQRVEITVTCAQVSLGEYGWLQLASTCPADPPRTVFGAYQPFQRGLMIYLDGADAAGQIYVLTDDGRYTVYEDAYIEGMPDPAGSPPTDDLLVPVRGFGQIWRALGGDAAGIGYGLAIEQGYDAQRQAAAPASLTTYLSTPAGVIALTPLPGTGGGWWSAVGDP